MLSPKAPSRTGRAEWTKTRIVWHSNPSAAFNRLR